MHEIMKYSCLLRISTRMWIRLGSPIHACHCPSHSLPQVFRAHMHAWNTQKKLAWSLNHFHTSVDLKIVVVGPLFCPSNARMHENSRISKDRFRCLFLYAISSLSSGSLSPPKIWASLLSLRSTQTRSICSCSDSPGQVSKKSSSKRSKTIWDIIPNQSQAPNARAHAWKIKICKDPDFSLSSYPLWARWDLTAAIHRPAYVSTRFEIQENYFSLHNVTVLKKPQGERSWQRLSVNTRCVFSSVESQRPATLWSISLSILYWYNYIQL